MKNILILHASGDKNNQQIALLAFSSISNYECIRYMIKMGWSNKMLKELKSKVWFVSWQYQARELFIYLRGVCNY